MTGSGRCGPGRSCWPPAASARSTTRRRTRACRPVTASRRRCGPARSSGIWSSCSSTRRCVARRPVARPAAAGQRGGPRRGRVPGRRTTACGSCRASTSSPTSRRATSWPRPSCARMDETGRAEHVARRPRRSAPRSGACGSRRSSRRLSEHGIDPVTDLIPVVPAAHYASGGIRDRPRADVRSPWPLRLRGGGLHRRPRRQPARVQLAARRAGIRPPDRRANRHVGREAVGVVATTRRPVWGCRRCTPAACCRK